MNATAKANYLRISPLKVRKIIQLVRGKKVEDSLYLLKTMPNKAAKMAYKVIASAKANFKNRFPETSDANLIIATIFANQAPILRRMMPRARGRADVLRKQSSHLTVMITDGQNQ